MTTRKTLTLVAALAFVGAGAAAAQQPTSRSQTKPTHVAAAARPQAKQTAAAQAKVAISRDSARALVMARSPKATILSEKLHRRDGRLMYDVRYREAGSKASHYVRVDATTGAITAVPMTASTSQKARKGS